MYARARQSLGEKAVEVLQALLAMPVAQGRIVGHDHDRVEEVVHGDDALQEELAEDIPDRKRGPHDREQEDRSEREDAEPLPDAHQPASGHAVFYLVQYRDLLISTGSSYGEEQVGRPRVSAGGCQ